MAHPDTRHRIAWPWITVGAAVVALALGVAIGALVTPSGDGDTPAEYNEAAHRRAAEHAIGHSVGDWDSYVDLAREYCTRDEHQFHLQLALAQDESPEWYALKLADVRHLCPERIADVVEYERVISSTEIP